MIWARVASMDLVCGPCFNILYCALCLEPTSTVGETSSYNHEFACVGCINNTPPLEENEDNEDYMPVPPDPFANFVTDDDLYDEVPDDDIYDEAPDDTIYYNITPIIPITYTITNNIPEPALYAPPAGFDMNMASVVEENQGLIDNLINAQVEYDGSWYFALDGQVYSVPYEIEIDDNYVRQDIVENWDDVRWTGSIFGQYIAWV
jgi:hypothetical protein